MRGFYAYFCGSQGRQTCFFPCLRGDNNDVKGWHKALAGASADPSEERCPAPAGQVLAPPKARRGISFQSASDRSVAFGPFFKRKPFCFGGVQLRLPVGQRVGSLPKPDRIAGIEFRI